MSLTADFKAFIVEQMQGFASVTLQPMFGGAAVKHNGLTFALLDDDTLYLKADERNRPDFEAEGLPPFTYQSKNGPMLIKGYHRAPPRCLDDPDEMTHWCRRSYEAAVHAAAHKRQKPPRKRK